MRKKKKSKSIDPDLIKFYEAFTRNEMSCRMPTVLKTINFKEDIFRLQQISLEMKRTLARAQIEKGKSLVDGESYN